MTAAKFISFEGGEGAGKSTQVKLLAGALESAGIDVLTTREPGGAPDAERIRGLLVEGAVDRWDATTEALLHFAARRIHVVETIRPALARGQWVVSDRFVDSTRAYQGYGHGLEDSAIESLSRLTIADLMPDLTVILDLPVAEGLRRAALRGGGEDRYERMGREFHQRLRDGFLDIARRAPARCAVVDGGGDIAAIALAVRAVVAQRLGVAFP